VNEGGGGGGVVVPCGIKEQLKGIFHFDLFSTCTFHSLHTLQSHSFAWRESEMIHLK
jgi:hypothetical protein